MLHYRVQYRKEVFDHKTKLKHLNALQEEERRMEKERRLQRMTEQVFGYKSS